MEKNNQKKGQEQQEDKKDWKRKWLLIVILLLLVLGLIITFRMGGGHKVTETVSKIPGINNIITPDVIDIEDEMDIEKEQERLQQEVEANTLNARIASSLNPNEEGVVYLSLKNKYEDKLLQVNVIDEKSEDVYYTSPVLYPGDTIDYGKLSDIPKSGNYDCIAYFYYYTLDEAPISMVGAKVNLNTEGE
jgi:flagellar basal body-associated protein FliL